MLASWLPGGSLGPGGTHRSFPRTGGTPHPPVPAKGGGQGEGRARGPLAVLGEREPSPRNQGQALALVPSWTASRPADVAGRGVGPGPQEEARAPSTSVPPTQPLLWPLLPQAVSDLPRSCASQWGGRRLRAAQRGPRTPCAPAGTEAGPWCLVLDPGYQVRSWDETRGSLNPAHPHSRFPEPRAGPQPLSDGPRAAQRKGGCPPPGPGGMAALQPGQALGRSRAKAWGLPGRKEHCMQKRVPLMTVPQRHSDN